MKRSEASTSQLGFADSTGERYTADWWYVSYLEVEQRRLIKLVEKQANAIAKLTGELRELKQR